MKVFFYYFTLKQRDLTTKSNEKKIEERKRSCGVYIPTNQYAWLGDPSILEYHFCFVPIYFTKHPYWRGRGATLRTHLNDIAWVFSAAIFGNGADATS